MANKTNMKTGDKVNVMLTTGEWCVGTINEISTGCEDYTYENPIAMVSCVHDNGGGFFMEHELELHDGEWWETEKAPLACSRCGDDITEYNQIYYVKGHKENFCSRKCLSLSMIGDACAINVKERLHDLSLRDRRIIEK